MPYSLTIDSIRSGMPGLRNDSAEMFSASASGQPPSSHSRVQASAWRKMVSVRRSIRPSFSIRSMNCTGARMPSCGWCQRARISTPSGRLLARLNLGWKKGTNCCKSSALTRSRLLQTRRSGARAATASPSLLAWKQRSMSFRCSATTGLASTPSSGMP